MGCVYQDFNSSKCTIYNEGFENPGVDEQGNCICCDDEDPSYLCESYESNDGDEDEDTTCDECGELYEDCICDDKYKDDEATATCDDCGALKLDCLCQD